MPVACLLIGHFIAKVEALRHPELRGVPYIVWETVPDGARAVLDRSREAAGVGAGMPLMEATSRCPRAALIPPDPRAYREAWERVMDALDARCPVVEDADVGVAFADLTGMERMYGGTEAMAAAALRAAPEAYLPRLGVGEGKSPAYLAARLASANSAFRLPQDVAGFLAPLSVGLLPVPWEIKQRLHGFGLETLGAVAAVGAGPMQAEFGPLGFHLWQMARGEDPSPVVPRQREETVHVSLSFEPSSASRITLLLALDRLVRRAYVDPLMRGRAARAATLRGGVEYRPPWERRVAFRAALSAQERALEALRPVLERAELPGPLEDLSLTLSGIVGETGTQASLLPEARRREHLDEAVQQMKARLGVQSPLYVAREVEPWSRHPERRYALVEYPP